MDYLKWAKGIFSDDKYATDATGIVIEEVALEYARCSLRVEKRHFNAMGSVMGGAIFTIADFAFAIASNTAGVPTVSLTSQINFLNLVKGKILFAEATAVKSGKSTCLYNIEITDDLGTAVARVATTGFRKSSDQSQNKAEK